MSFGSTEFSVEAYIIEPIINPYGMKQLEINEAGVQLGLTYSGSPSLGIAGNFTLVDTDFAFLIKFDPMKADRNVFYAEVHNLNFTTLYRGIYEEKVPAPLNKFTDNFAMQHGLLSIATP